MFPAACLAHCGPQRASTCAFGHVLGFWCGGACQAPVARCGVVGCCWRCPSLLFAVYPLLLALLLPPAAVTQTHAQESTRPRGGLRFLRGEELDPTLALGFFFDGLGSFRDFLVQAEPFSGPAAVQRGIAIFSFAELSSPGTPDQRAAMQA